MLNDTPYAKTAETITAGVTDPTVWADNESIDGTDFTVGQYIIADADEIRRDVIWFTDKKRDGSTELYSLSDFKTSEIRKGKGRSYLNAYKAGKFGAIPNVGSIFVKED